jgi:hypothetical protein
MPEGWVAAWYAASDCERIRPGLVGQPVNAASSAAYLVAAAWLLTQAERGPAERGPVGRRRYRLLAAVVAANGIGSGLYHGPGWAVGRWCHDVAAVAVPMFVAVDGLGGVRDWNDRRITGGYLSAVALTSVALLAPAATNVVVLGAATAAVLAEAAVARQRTAWARASPEGPMPTRRSHRRRRPGPLIMVSALAVAITAYLLGPTGAPLCRPDSLLQPHALWHLLTAVAMAAWGADRMDHPVHA